MPRRQIFDIPGHAHFLTFSVYRRVPVLANAEARDLLSQHLRAVCDRYEFDLWAYVLMPDHVHLLVWPRAEKYSVAAFLSSLKQPTAARILSVVPHLHSRLRTGLSRPGREIRLWERGGGYDRNLYSPPEVWKTIRYIHFNPVRRGLVTAPEDWSDSSAAAYAGGSAPVRVDLCPVILPSEGVFWSV